MPYKVGDQWMAQIKLDSKKIRKRFSTKTEAIAWEVKRKSVRKNNKAKPITIKATADCTTPTISLHKWATQYLDFAEIKFSHKTYLEKRQAFKKLFSSMDNSLQITKLTPGIVLNHLQGQVAERSGNAANKDRKNLVAAWNWGIKYMGIPTLNPCLVEKFPEERQERYVPPEKDFWKVYDVAESDQDQVMLFAYLHLAARRSELFKLKWQDVDFVESKVKLYTRKRKDSSLECDWLPLTDDLHQALLLHYQHRNGEFVFPDPKTEKPYISRQLWMRRLCTKAGVKPFGLHGIRHLTASILARENTPMIDIQTILRHKNLSTTERYIRRVNSVRPVLSVLPGRGSRKGPQKEKRAHKACEPKLTLITVNS